VKVLYLYYTQGDTKAPLNVILPRHFHSRGNSQIPSDQLISDFKPSLSNKLKPYMIPIVEPLLNKREERINKILVNRPATTRKPMRILKKSKIEFIPIKSKLQKDNIYDKKINKNIKFRLHSPSNASPKQVTGTRKSSFKIINEMYFKKGSKRYCVTSHNHTPTQNSMKEESNDDAMHKIYNDYYRNNFTIASRRPHRAESILLSSLVGEVGETCRSNKGRIGSNKSAKCVIPNLWHASTPVDNLKNYSKPIESPLNYKQSKKLNTPKEDMGRRYWNYRKLNSDLCVIKYLM